MKANAVVFTAPNEVSYEAVDCPDPGPGDAVVRLTQSWISIGTEGSYLRGERVAGDTAYRGGDDPWPFPVVAGYQAVGVVEAVGDEIDDLAVGETVYRSLGKVNGMYHECGGHVSPSVTAREWIFKLPAEPDPVAFSGLVLAQVGYNCATRVPVAPGDDAVVIGDGLVGQWAAQTLAWQGARVAMAGTEDDRLPLAAKHAKAATINVRNTELAEAIREFAPDRLAIAVDAAGSRESTEKLIGWMRNRGTIVTAGFCGTDDKISLQSLRDYEIAIAAVSGWSQKTMDETLRGIADGHLQTLPLITHHFPVQEAPEVWKKIQALEEPMLGVILEW